MPEPTLKELRDQAQGFYLAARKGWFSLGFCRENIERIEREMEAAQRRERQQGLFGEAQR